MTDHHRDICTLCGQPGHNASQCPAERWPRWLGRWLAIYALSMTFVAVVYGLRLV